jgi:hypothetical protein
MTFDEIQETIEGMLAVQRELQESQLKLVEKQAVHDENLTRIETNMNQLQNLINDLAQLALTSDNALLNRIEAIEERVFPEQN